MIVVCSGHLVPLAGQPGTSLFSGLWVARHEGMDPGSGPYMV